MKLNYIDNGNCFNFGNVSEYYGKFRDIYPKSLYKNLVDMGIGKEGQNILDVGSGTAVLPRNMSYTKAFFTANDISAEQISVGKAIADENKIENIGFCVGAVEDINFEDDSFDAVTAVQCFHYFNTDTFIPKLHRILKQSGLFCKIFMDWLPFEDKIVNEMEKTVLKYNPEWTGGGFKQYEYYFPDWAKNRFDLFRIYSYNTYIPFSVEQWLGRIITCRGVGASLDSVKLNDFTAEYKSIIDTYNQDSFSIKHQIHIEVYRKI